MRFNIILFCFFVIVSCKKPTPRRPVNKAQTITKTKNYSIAFNKAINQHQEKKIASYIKKDTTLNYIDSNFGFRYAVVQSSLNQKKEIKKGTKLTYLKTISKLNNKQVYPTTKQSIVLGKSEEIKGIIHGIKLMKEDEEFKFIFTSFAGYGMYGDEKKIVGNTPIIVNIKLLNINN